MLTTDETIRITRERESSAANTFRISDRPPVFVRGDGPWLFTEQGSRYLDLVCGSATTNLGHGHPAHRRAVEEAASGGIVHTGTRLPSPWRAALYGRLAEILPSGIGCFQLANAGTEAIEIAIKVAQYQTGRRRVLAFEGGYHGRTLGALSVTHGARIREPFSTLDDLVDFLPYPYAGDPVGPVHDVASCLDALESRLAALTAGDDRPAAILVEPIQGVGGVIAPPMDFLRGVRALADRFGVLLVADEIWTGFGRTGRMFAFEHANVEPDMVVMGKALSGGLPLSAVGGPASLLKSWPAGMHTSTFQGNPLACAMACATIDTIRDDGLLEHVETVIESTLERLLRPLECVPGVHAVRINGAQAGIELVTEAGAPDAGAVVRLQRLAAEKGVLVYGGGRHANVLMLVVPLVIEEADLAYGLRTVANLVRG
jgi:4-aminobutyrate aminotransferase